MRAVLPKSFRVGGVGGEHEPCRVTLDIHRRIAFRQLDHSDTRG